MRKRIAALVVAMLMAMSMVGGTVFAGHEGIGHGQTAVCVNPAGQEPQGQCRGQALEKEVRNPAGHAPPGQQP